jgi:hypothetical protein
MDFSEYRKFKDHIFWLITVALTSSNAEILKNKNAELSNPNLFSKPIPLMKRREIMKF